MTLQILEKKENENGPILEQKWSDFQLTLSWNLLYSIVDKQNTIYPQTGCDVKVKPEQLGINKKLSHVKTLGKKLGTKIQPAILGSFLSAQ
jgi:hypothetical protein